MLTSEDFERLTKLLNLTQSDNDNEALAAVRQANKLLKNKNLSWPLLFKDQAEKQKPYRWHPCPQNFSASFFKQACECREFISFLRGDQVQALKTYVKFYNALGYISQDKWNGFVEVWNDFREKRR